MTTNCPVRLLIVEEALRSLAFGHWYEYLKAITEGMIAAGIKVEILAAKSAEPEVLQTLPARPVLRYSAWEFAYYSKNPLKRWLGTLQHNFRFASDLAAHLEKAQPYDIILAPTIQPHHILGWYRIARRYGGKKFNRLVIICVHGPGIPLGNGRFQFSASSRFFRTVLRRMEPLHRTGRVTFVCETRKAVEHFRQLCGMEFALFPHVVAFPPISRTDRGNADGHVTLGSLGGPRTEKGSDLLQRMAVSLLKRPDKPPVKFVIQWLKGYRNSQGEWAKKAEPLTTDPHVEFIDTALNTEQYQARLRLLDGLILPYQTRHYYDRVSRVATEAVCLGLPFIYPHNSWLEDVAERCGAGVGFEDGNAADLERAVIEFAARKSELQTRAAERSALARRYHSPERFRTLLLQQPDELAAMAF